MTTILNSIPFPKDTVEVEHFGEDSIYLRIKEVDGMGGTPAFAMIRVSVDELRDAVDGAAPPKPTNPTAYLETLWESATVGVPHAGDRVVSRNDDGESFGVYTTQIDHWSDAGGTVRILERAAKEAPPAIYVNPESAGDFYTYDQDSVRDYRPHLGGRYVTEDELIADGFVAGKVVTA